MPTQGGLLSCFDEELYFYESSRIVEDHKSMLRVIGGIFRYVKSDCGHLIAKLQIAGRVFVCM